MDSDCKSCNFLYSVVLDASIPHNPVSLQIRRNIRSFKWLISGTFKSIVHPRNGKNEVTADVSENNTLNLQPGEWVQVRSIDEIFATLNEEKKYKGLYFMPEMEKFCGQKFKVFKKVEVIKLESTGEVRRLRSPTVFLEGVYCKGERQDGCDRSCFHFWREVWLNRIS
jgi:hypothetical protein